MRRTMRAPHSVRQQIGSTIVRMSVVLAGSSAAGGDGGGMAGGGGESDADGGGGDGSSVPGAGEGGGGEGDADGGGSSMPGINAGALHMLKKHWATEGFCLLWQHE